MSSQLADRLNAVIGNTAEMGSVVADFPRGEQRRIPKARAASDNSFRA
jgi:hypothetical protein